MILAEYSRGSASRSAADLCLGDLSGADVERFGDVFQKTCAQGAREARMDLARTLTGWTPKARPAPWGLSGFGDRSSDMLEIALQGANVLASVEATSQIMLADLGEGGLAGFVQIPVQDPIIGQPCVEGRCPDGYRCFDVATIPPAIARFISAADRVPRCVKDIPVSDDPLDGFHQLMREYEPYMPSWLYNFINGAVETVFGFIKDFLGIVGTIKRKVQELVAQGADFVRDGIKSLNPGTETGRRNILKAFLAIFTAGVVSPVGIVPSSAVDTALDEYSAARARGASTVEMVASVLGKVFLAITNGPAFQMIGIGIAAVQGNVVGAISKASTLILGIVQAQIAKHSEIASQITGILKTLLDSTDSLKAILAKGAAAMEEESTYFLLGGMIQAAGGTVGAFGFVIADNARLVSSALKNGVTHEVTQALFRAKFIAPVEAAILKAKADAQAAGETALATSSKIKNQVQESGAAALDSRYGDAMSGVSGILTALGQILDSIGATLRDGKLIPFQIIRDAGAAISAAGQKLQKAAGKVLQFGKSVQKLTSKLANPEQAVKDALVEVGAALPDPKVVAAGSVDIVKDALGVPRAASEAAAGEEAAAQGADLLTIFQGALQAYDRDCAQFGECGSAVASNPAVQADREKVLKSLAAGEVWGINTANNYIEGIKRFLSDRAAKRTSAREAQEAAARRSGKQPFTANRKRVSPTTSPSPISGASGIGILAFGAAAFAGALVVRAKRR